MELQRRTVLLGSVALSAVAAAPGGGALATTRASRVVNLRTNQLEAPLGVETPRPRLSWRLAPGPRNLRQSAYRIRVASTAEALAAGRADLWDSGRVSGARCTDVAYAGAALSSRQVCHWSVEAWDQDGRSLGSSAAAVWEMGFLAPQDWSAGWIAAEDEERLADLAAGLTWIGSADGRARAFRRTLRLERAADVEMVLATSFRTVSVWVDGRPVQLPAWSKNAMGPPPAYELVLPMSAGDHVLAVQIGGTPTIMPASGALAMLAKVRHPEGRIDRLAGPSGWRVAGPAPEGFSAPGFVDSDWTDAVARTGIERQPWPPAPGVYLRRGFEVAKPVRRARLYVSALGAYRAHLNGAPIDDSRLSPGSTDFRKRIRYRVYDVTAKVKPGANAIGLHVGDGWYGSYFPLVGTYAFGPPPRQAIAQLELTHDDGSVTRIGTDGDWRAVRSPVLRSQIFEGETYDARAERKDWSAPAATDDWTAAVAAPTPQAKLVSEAAPPVRPTIVMQPHHTSRPAAGVRLVDFGQNFAGWARLKVRAKAGDRLELRFAEVLGADGRIDQSNLRGALARDIYIGRGQGEETFEPDFTYHGFRYVEVHGPEAALADLKLEGMVVHTDLPVTGDLRTGSPIIDQLWRNTLWSQRSNFVGLPTDCPQRDERLGWTGDAAAFWDAAAFNMDVDAFTRRFLEDVRDGQTAEGAYPDFAPAAASIQGRNPSPSPGWADAGVILPWTTWRRYGDTAVIEENLSAMTRYLEFVRGANPDHVWRRKRGADFGDWLALDAKNPGDPTTPKDLVATACWARSAEMVSEMVAAVGGDAATFAAERKTVGEAFAQAFVQPDGSIGNGSQTGYILGLRFGLVPPALRRAAGERLVADIRRRGGVLSTGFLGTPHALDVLADLGETDLLYDLLLRTEYPSWGYMVRQGATSIWERWNSDTGDVSMNSFNHYALGGVCGFVFRRVVGIDAAEPGFSKIAVRPLIHGKIGRASATYQSVKGPIAVGWEVQKSGRYAVSLEVPSNTTAELQLPGTSGAPMTVGSGPHRFTGRLT